MALESHIERESCRIYREMGAVATIKVGTEGWPDRLVLLGNGRHWWAEFKQPTGRLRAVQERRIKQLQDAGEIVFVPRSVATAVEDFHDAVRRLRER